MMKFSKESKIMDPFFDWFAYFIILTDQVDDVTRVLFQFSYYRSINQFSQSLIQCQLRLSNSEYDIHILLTQFRTDLSNGWIILRISLMNLFKNLLFLLLVYRYMCTRYWSYGIHHRWAQWYQPTKFRKNIRGRISWSVRTRPSPA